MIDDLEKLDSVILHPIPSITASGIKPRRSAAGGRWAHRGEMTKACLSILRQSVEPMTTRDIAEYGVTRC